MLTLNDKFPTFKKLSSVSVDTTITEAFPTVEYTENNELIIDGKTNSDTWMIVFAYPKDFTFICPTEIRAFGDLNEDFEDLDAKVLAISTDSEFVHRAWRMDNETIKDVPFPLIADNNHSLSKDLGIYNEEDGVAERATFIVDPNGVIQHASIYNGSVGRNPNEIVRILTALQEDELCPCNWKAGDDTIHLD